MCLPRELNEPREQRDGLELGKCQGLFPRNGETKSIQIDTFKQVSQQVTPYIDKAPWIASHVPIWGIDKIKLHISYYVVENLQE